MTAEDAARLEAEYAALRQTLEDLDRDVAAREQAKARATDAARRVGDQLARVGHYAELAGETFNAELARKLYWGYPDIHVAEIAHPMRLHEAQVSKHVGTGDFEKACANGCGRTVSWHMRNRTDGQRQPRYCEPCQAVRETERERDRRAWRARDDAEHRANVEALKTAVESGARIRRYADFPGVPHTWEVDENGIPLALRDEK